MHWRPLGKSKTFGVDWEEIFRRPHSRVDPYLVWAAVTDFRGLSKLPLKFLQIAVESKRNRQEEIQRTLGVRIRHIVGGIYTAYVPLKALKLLFDANLSNDVSRLVMGMPTQTEPDESYFAVVTSPPSKLPKIAIIDDGCAFAHRDFREYDGKDWKSRFAGIWDQNPGADPTGTGAGAFTRAQLETYLAAAKKRDGVDEDACYRQLSVGFSPEYATDYLFQLRTPASHGNHVLDVAAGHPNPLAGIGIELGTKDDPASKADILFVQLPRATVKDTSGGSLDIYVLEALSYLRNQCPKNSLVVNLSYGSYAGPHDGSTLIETAMDAFVADAAFPSAIVLPAGNAYDARIHAAVSLKGGESKPMSVHVQPDSLTDTFVELWYSSSVPVSSKSITFEIIPPGDTGSGPCPLNTGLLWFMPTPANPNPTDPAAGIFNIESPVTGTLKSLGILIVAPTGEVTPPRPRPPHGIWQINVTNTSAKAVAIDVLAWIERDDASFGSGRSQSQATFLSAGFGAEPGAPHAASDPIARESNMNSIGNGSKTTVVGGYVLKQKRVARYSAAGPSIAPDTREHPDLVGACEESEVLNGMLAAGNRSGLPFRMNGTSVAAPVIARKLVSLLATTKAMPGIPIPIPTKKLPLEVLPPGHPPVIPALREGEGRPEP